MANSTNADIGNKAEAIANARRLLRAGDFASAAEQAREISMATTAVPRPGACSAWRSAHPATSRKPGMQRWPRSAESRLHPDMFQATLAIADNRLDEAEQLLRDYLKDQRDDAAALRLLAEIGARLGRLMPPSAC